MIAQIRDSGLNDKRMSFEVKVTFDKALGYGTNSQPQIHLGRGRLDTVKQ